MGIMANSSGLDALLEALRQSGVNTGDMGGSGRVDVDAEDASSERLSLIHI